MSSLQIEQAVDAPSPDAFGAYLRSRGWEFVALQGNWIVYRLGTSEVQVPRLTGARDYGLAVSLLLQNLERVEGRSQAALVRDVRAAGNDIVRLHLEGSALRDGRVSVAGGARLYQAARDLMAAAASSVLKPRAVHPRARPADATRLLDSARFGMPEFGSFVLTIEAAVPPLLQGSLLDEHDTNVPLERKTSLLLAEAMQETQVALSEAGATNSAEPFKERASRGVSANLCDALAELLSAVDAEKLTTSVSFATQRPVRRTFSAITFTAEQAPYLKSASTALRSVTGEPEMVLIGTVTKCASEDPSRGGTVTIQTWMVDATTPRAVRLELEADDYQRALTAHGTSKLISVEGDLAMASGRWTLHRVRSFEVLPSEP